MPPEHRLVFSRFCISLNADLDIYLPENVILGGLLNGAGVPEPHSTLSKQAVVLLL